MNKFNVGDKITCITPYGRQFGWHPKTLRCLVVTRTPEIPKNRYYVSYYTDLFKDKLQETFLPKDFVEENFVIEGQASAILYE